MTSSGSKFSNAETDGSYECLCDDGFELEGATNQCVDINECLGANDCTTDGACLNTLGSYECACPEGKFMKKLLTM